jgi:hypothetical protein
VVVEVTADNVAAAEVVVLVEVYVVVAPLVVVVEVTADNVDRAVDVPVEVYVVDAPLVVVVAVTVLNVVDGAVDVLVEV